MTTQPRIALDDLTSDALDALYEQLDRAERVARSAARDAELALTAQLAAEARVAELETDVARLTAGQCLDQRAMCEQHHAPPVDGCPYPRCRAARATGRAATA